MRFIIKKKALLDFLAGKNKNGNFFLFVTSFPPFRKIPREKCHFDKEKKSLRRIVMLIESFIKRSISSLVIRPWKIFHVGVDCFWEKENITFNSNISFGFFLNIILQDFIIQTPSRKKKEFFLNMFFFTFISRSFKRL